MRLKHVLGAAAGAALGLSAVVVASAGPNPAHQTFTIGVDHFDAANQQPLQHRVLEYTDFFSRSLSIHTGDTIDFRIAPAAFHIVALAKSEEVARDVYPVFLNDTDLPQANDTAIGTGDPKVVLGPSNVSITGGSTSGGGTFGNNPQGPPVCGLPKQAHCTFSGGNDIEVIGPNVGVNSSGVPAFVDQLVDINAPPGHYAFFCYIHPGMRGDLRVVGPNHHTSTQADINADGQAQFLADRKAALEVESDMNRVVVNREEPGERTFVVHMGANTPDLHGAWDEIFPNQPLDLVRGDRVRFIWADPHNAHSVSFPANSGILPPPFGFDCGTSFSASFCTEPGGSVENILDPGTSPPGTRLTVPSALVDAGVLVGTGYGLHPSEHDWSLTTGAATSEATFSFQCTIHDWMQNSLQVT